MRTSMTKEREWWKQIGLRTSLWTCEKCGQFNTEYFPWPVNAECEKCGHAQVFGVEKEESCESQEK